MSFLERNVRSGMSLALCSNRTGMDGSVFRVGDIIVTLTEMQGRGKDNVSSLRAQEKFEKE